MTSLPLISLRGASLCYVRRLRRRHHCDFWALQNISFDLIKGETLGVIGRNGAGKSTLLRLLAGIVAPDRGEVITHGASASLLSLQVGFLPHLSGRENAMLSGILLGLTPKQMRERMNDIVAFSELGDVIDAPLKTYSHGMRARLGFAVSFLTDPEILLVDEVLGVGDIEFRKKSSGLLKERIRSDRTAVVVSHSLHTIRELCDRVAWIQRGKLFAIGDTGAVLKDYEATAST